MYEYFYGEQSNQFSFYRIPKILFTDEIFKNISPEAKILYGILLDRMSLSQKNGWTGYYGQIIQKYKKIQPRAKFFLVTLPKDDTYPKNKEHRDLLFDITQEFDNCYLIDLNTYAPDFNKEIKETFFMHNHMNPAGYVFTADIIMSYIDYIVRSNIHDFDEIAFIGTDITNR